MIWQTCGTDDCTDVVVKCVNNVWLERAPGPWGVTQVGFAIALGDSSINAGMNLHKHQP